MKENKKFRISVSRHELYIFLKLINHRLDEIQVYFKNNDISKTIYMESEILIDFEKRINKLLK